MSGNGVLENNFNADIGPGQSKTLTIGVFTFQEYNSGSGCTDPTISAQTQPSDWFVATNNGSFHQEHNNQVAYLSSSSGKLGDFSAVTATGASTIWGIGGDITSGTNCLTSGGAVGD